MAIPRPAAPADDYNKQFEVARNRAATQANADLQAKKDALARRAAQLGGGPSGAFIKAEQGAIDETQKNLGAANEQIDAAQQAEARRIKEVQDAQRFQTSEREASQTFAAGQTAMDRRIQEAGITGTYNGQSTMQSRQYDDMKAVQENEFKENLRMSYATAMLSAYNSKMDPKLLQQYLNDFDLDFDDKGGVIVNPPRVPGLTTAAAGPKGATSTPADLKTRQRAGVTAVRRQDGVTYYSDGSFTDRYGKFHPGK
jgi:hypothetical protein